MTFKVRRFAVALLLGFLLSAYPIVQMSGASPSIKSCCHHAEHCCNMPCCAAPKTPSAPVAPAPVPSPSQHELQGLSASILSLLSLPSPVAHEFPSRISLLPPMTAIPLFQRDCCYLI
jgi:hypothetical protein